METEWFRFKVGEPSKNIRWNEACCSPFEEISHTTHIDTAFKIIKDGKISANLIFDESILNHRRVLVTWLSPNHWSEGYRYGNIKFNFSFPNIIENKRFYWVESIAYRVPACRILITTKEHTDLPAYNPEDHNGPWWYDKESQKHYYNNNYCLEFMFEENISLHNLRSIDFCDHHPKFCSINKSTPSICAELGISANIASAYFIIQAMGNGVDIFNYPGIKCDTPKDPFATSQIRNAATSFIYIKRNNEPFSGPVCKDCDGAKELMKTIMSLYSPQNLRRTRILASLFCSRDDFLDVAQSIFCECLGYNPFDFDNPLLSSKKISM